MTRNREPELSDDIIILGDRLAEAVHSYIEACDYGRDAEQLDALREKMRVARARYSGESA